MNHLKRLTRRPRWAGVSARLNWPRIASTAPATGKRASGGGSARPISEIKMTPGTRGWSTGPAAGRGQLVCAAALACLRAAAHVVRLRLGTMTVPRRSRGRAVPRRHRRPGPSRSCTSPQAGDEGGDRPGQRFGRVEGYHGPMQRLPAPPMPTVRLKPRLSPPDRGDPAPGDDASAGRSSTTDPTAPGSRWRCCCDRATPGRTPRRAHRGAARGAASAARARPGNRPDVRCWSAPTRLAARTSTGAMSVIDWLGCLPKLFRIAPMRRALDQGRSPPTWPGAIGWFSSRTTAGGLDRVGRRR